MTGIDLATEWLKFGFPGLMLITFLLCIKYLLDQQKEERKECSSTAKENAQQFVRLVEKNTEAFIELKNIIRDRQ